MPQTQSIHRRIPSIDRLLTGIIAERLIKKAGREQTVNAYRQASDELRRHLAQESNDATDDIEHWLNRRADQLVTESLRPSLQTVFNLTGTVLHTNLGRAPLPEESINAMVRVASSASNLEYDIESGQRGNRDNHVQRRLCELTGAEAATVVNNNAAAVLLTLNTVANGRSVAVSRGELIEIGDSFRIPDIMTRSGCHLMEVGTTNRTHERDYRDAIAEGAVALMRVHASNFSMQGFTSGVPDKALANLAKTENSVFINDLGSGALIDLTSYGLPDEPTAAAAIADGADIVTFSGDKLLGGPQCGLIVGSRQWIEKINKNPMKRALRCDKLTLAALESLLTLYTNPDKLISQVPTLRLLTRTVDDIKITAHAIKDSIQSRVAEFATVETLPCHSQVGSGAQPTELLPSVALVVTPHSSSGKSLKTLASDFRQLPIPVIGRLHEGALWLDLRCLEETKPFIDNLGELH